MTEAEVTGTPQHSPAPCEPHEENYRESRQANPNTEHGTVREYRGSTSIVAAAVVAGVLVCDSLSGCSSASSRQASTSAPPQPELNGTYTFVTNGSQLTINGQPRAGGVPSTTTWEITPCGPACSHVKASLGWSTDLHLVDNKWQATRRLPMDCVGNPVTSTMTYVIDSATLAGTVTNDIPCGNPPSVAVLPATLTKK